MVDQQTQDLITQLQQDEATITQAVNDAAQRVSTDLAAANKKIDDLTALVAANGNLTSDMQALSDSIKNHLTNSQTLLAAVQGIDPAAPPQTTPAQNP